MLKTNKNNASLKFYKNQLWMKTSLYMINEIWSFLNIKDNLNFTIAKTK